MKKSNEWIWLAMARRKKRFHKNEDWHKLRLWGLFEWQDISSLLKKGLLITKMKKENHIVWVYPSEEAYKNYIEPLLKLSLEEIEKRAGW